MNWSMGSGDSQIWLLLLCTVVGAVISGSIYGAYLLWRKRSEDDVEPLPHCNLEERLAQIDKSTMQQFKEIA